MRIISITGTASGVGKTAVACFLIKNTPGISALKITTKHEGNCPRHSDCTLCETMQHPYTITWDAHLINRAGKDTALFKDAGARKVIWLQTHSEYLKTGIDVALSYFQKNDLILVEGNSFLHSHDADLSILVATPREKKIKRSTRQIISKIDLVVINRHIDDTERDIVETRERLLRMGCHSHVFVINPFQYDYTTNRSFIMRVHKMVGEPARSKLIV